MPSKKGTVEAGTWRYTAMIQEEHARPIYNLQFNTCDLRHRELFATVGSNRATVYRRLPHGQTELLQAYVDDNKNESFFSCAFSVDESDGSPLLAIAGLTGLIKLINLTSGTTVKVLTGHGNSVNDLKVHSKYPSLILSASKDESVRLWNLQTGVTVLIFAGSGGHGNEVLSCDFHPLKEWQFASCGMDNAVKVWDFREDSDLVMRSFKWDVTSERRVTFPTKCHQCNILSTTQAHPNYVDCVRWLGDLLLTKSVDNRAVLWKPEDEPHQPNDAIRIVNEYKLEDADIWFIRFSLDFKRTKLAVGNRQGKVLVFTTDRSPPTLLARLKHPTMRLPIRQTAFSHDGKTLLCCCEDGSVLRWDDDNDEGSTGVAAPQTAGGSTGAADKPAPSNSARSSSPEEEEEEEEEAEEELEESEESEEEDRHKKKVKKADPDFVPPPS